MIWQVWYGNGLTGDNQVCCMCGLVGLLVFLIAGLVVWLWLRERKEH